VLGVEGVRGRGGSAVVVGLVVVVFIVVVVAVVVLVDDALRLLPRRLLEGVWSVAGAGSREAGGVGGRVRASSAARL
jgi:hypothetical protein